MLWPNHPLGRDIGGAHESVDGITRDMMLAHLERHYTPSNIVLSVAGGVPHAEVAARAAELSRWLAKPRARRTRPYERPPDEEARLRLEYRKTEQLHMSIALPGLALSDPDIYALDLLSVILGGGMSSRLFVELREKRGLAYDVHSGVTHFRDTGAFVISRASTRRRRMRRRRLSWSSCRRRATASRRKRRTAPKALSPGA